MTYIPKCLCSLSNMRILSFQEIGFENIERNVLFKHDIENTLNHYPMYFMTLDVFQL